MACHRPTWHDGASVDDLTHALDILETGSPHRAAGRCIDHILLCCPGNGSGSGNVVRGMAAALEEEREAAEAAAMGRAVERRKWKAEQKDLLDEMLPSATAGTRCAHCAFPDVHVL